MIDLDTLKFDENGLISAIAQDNETGEVLMFAFMNREALEKTIETGIAHYWSRSRQKLWKKGESSGHMQKVHELLIDCDTGYRSCFYRNIEGDVVGEKVFDPADVY